MMTEQYVAAIVSLLARERVDKLRTGQLRLDARRLAGHGFKAFSQMDEDGILQEMFRRIGTSSRVFVEFGCGNGLENNTIYLLLSGWSGLWMDGSAENIESVRRLHLSALRSGALRAEQRVLTAENIDETVSTLCSEKDVDLLSIDIDGNDYWVWNGLNSLHPRVVVIEYNATFRPPLSLVQRYCPERCWDGTNYFGASLKALERLGEAKGYRLVGCNLAGQNAFFVRQDCIGADFCAPFTAENHYMPPNYDLFPPAAGHAHPPGIGEYVSV